MMNDHSEWVSLRRAADILGVHPATVRNWADQGILPSRRTAGGHRRFRVGDLAKHAQSHEENPPLEVQVIIQNALGQMRLEMGEGAITLAPWYAAMSDATKQTLRSKGREVLEAMRRYLSNGAPDHLLAEAIQLGKVYAQILSDDRLSLPNAVRGFLYFSDFMSNAVLTWSELTPPRSAPEWATLLRQVNTFVNAMLLSIIEYYEEE
ncbi:MAG: helix-turn-helix domain-containing protein [Anaerolineae bacterium]|jgi:excisionase family DNA binding protein|nr:helix-turn-helix domain-containing protein [Anaerolineae bacterium]